MSNTDAKYIDPIFRKDHPMVLAKNRHQASLMPVSLKYSSTDLKAGQVMARNSVTGLYEKYVNGGASGLGTAVGILMEDKIVEDFASTGATVTARVITKGEVFENLLTGLDAQAKTDLKARSLVDGLGNQILSF